MTKDEFNALPLLKSFFPLVFRSGGRWEQFSGMCGSCDVAFKDENFRGTVVLDEREVQPPPLALINLGDDEVPKLSAQVFTIKALGYCPKCDLLTPIEYQMHENMGMSGYDTSGKWTHWERPKKRV